MNKEELKEEFGRTNYGSLMQDVFTSEQYYFILDWWLAKIDQARQDERKKVVEWLERRCKANIKAFGTDKWNGDMEDLLAKLKE